MTTPITKYDFLASGTRTRCEYRNTHEGTILSVTDPRAWYGRFETEEEVIQHLEHMAKMNRRMHSQYNMPLVHSDKQPVLWDFGKIYWETVKDLYPA